MVVLQEKCQKIPVFCMVRLNIPISKLIMKKLSKWIGGVCIWFIFPSFFLIPCATISKWVTNIIQATNNTKIIDKLGPTLGQHTLDSQIDLPDTSKIHFFSIYLYLDDGLNFDEIGLSNLRIYENQNLKFSSAVL